MEQLLGGGEGGSSRMFEPDLRVKDVWGQWNPILSHTLQMCFHSCSRQLSLVNFILHVRKLRLGRSNDCSKVTS